MRVLISQRSDRVIDRDERRDALDGLWLTTIEQLLGVPVSMWPVPNAMGEAAVRLVDPATDLIVLSGGNNIGSVPERDATEAALLDGAARLRIPVLGVCRGMQMMQHHLGGTLVRVEGHVGTQHWVHAHTTTELPKFWPAEYRANSFHDWGIAEHALAPRLHAAYLHGDHTVEACEHDSLPWLGVMWHPERKGNGADALVWLAAWLKRSVRGTE